MKDILITIYYKDVHSMNDPGLVCFNMKGNSIEEVAQMLTDSEGKQVIEIEGGYKIINFDTVCWIDVQYASISEPVGSDGGIYFEETT